jgi:cytochrome b6-f complex iron-sulfur subunit
MSVAEIMAAARAAKASAGAAPPATAATPAAPKPTPAPAAPKVAKAEAATPVATGPKDTASILAAARKTAKPGPITKAEAAAKASPVEPAAKKKIAVPPMPAKPDYAKAPVATPASTDRRNFLALGTAWLIGSPLAIGFTTLAITHLMWLLGLARFMFPNVLIEPPTRFKVGFPDTLAPGQVETKFIPQFGVWIVKYEYEGSPMIYALKAVCTHLGCTPNWLEAEQKFKCPCHGSGFYKDGVNFEGPAPRPLERYAVSIADDGQLMVDKSRTFNQELGGWADPGSYVSV